VPYTIVSWTRIIQLASLRYNEVKTRYKLFTDLYILDPESK